MLWFLHFLNIKVLVRFRFFTFWKHIPDIRNSSSLEIPLYWFFSVQFQFQPIDVFQYILIWFLMSFVTSTNRASNRRWYCHCLRFLLTSYQKIMYYWFFLCRYMEFGNPIKYKCGLEIVAFLESLISLRNLNP